MLVTNAMLPQHRVRRITSTQDLGISSREIKGEVSQSLGVKQSWSTDPNSSPTSEKTQLSVLHNPDNADVLCTLCGY